MKSIGLYIVGLASLVILTGCRTIDREGIYGRYYRTTLNQSTSADVLGYIQAGKEHLSQSESVVASWGDDYDTRTNWFNMVTFDEEKLVAERKYVVTMEDYRGPNTKPRPQLRLDAEIVLDEETLNAAYPSENQKRIEIVRKVAAKLLEDSQTISNDSEILQGTCMLANQTLNNLLNKLRQSPALAQDLPNLEGMEFDQMTMGTSRARMLIQNDIVKLKIKAGPGWFKSEPFEKHADVVDM